MSYAILDQNVLYSTTMREGPMVFAVWCAILSSKDQDGITGLNPAALALLWSNPEKNSIVPVKPIQEAWKVLASPDPDSKSKDHEGRRIIPTGDGRWLVVNHEKYRTMFHKERRRVQVMDAKRRQRDRERGNGGSK